MHTSIVKEGLGTRQSISRTLTLREEANWGVVSRHEWRTGFMVDSGGARQRVDMCCFDVYTSLLYT